MLKLYIICHDRQIMLSVVFDFNGIFRTEETFKLLTTWEIYFKDQNEDRDEDDERQDPETYDIKNLKMGTLFW